MVRSVRVDRYSRTSEVPQAGLLLLILLAHLALMASAFHQVMVAPGGDHQAAVVGGDDGSRPQLVSLGGWRPADCAIQWATSPWGSLTALLIGAAVLGWMRGALASGQIWRPLARANGPPGGDRQALLQVFRL